MLVEVLSDQCEIPALTREVLRVAGVGKPSGRADMKVRDMPVFDHLPKRHDRGVPLELGQPLYGENARIRQRLLLAIEF